MNFKYFKRNFKYYQVLPELIIKEGHSKHKSPQPRQVQEKLVLTLEQTQVPKWGKTRCQEGYAFPVGGQKCDVIFITSTKSQNDLSNRQLLALI